MSIQDCKELVGPWLEFKYPMDGHQMYAVVPWYPDVILESDVVELWAHSLDGDDVEVNMRSPQMRRFFRRLAEKGVGYADDYGPVRYKISPSMFFSR